MSLLSLRFSASHGTPESRRCFVSRRAAPARRRDCGPSRARAPDAASRPWPRRRARRPPRARPKVGDRICQRRRLCCCCLAEQGAATAAAVTARRRAGVSLEWKNNFRFCGGSLIAPNLVLTAARGRICIGETRRGRAPIGRGRRTWGRGHEPVLWRRAGSTFYGEGAPCEGQSDA
jgi:hypothetical protein